MPDRRALPCVAVFATASAALLSMGPAWSAEACEAHSGVFANQVVELYTSEGCNSCPPADRWLSTLKGRDDVVALAFHVDYWDNLGWKDRFASPAYSERQTQQRGVSGAGFVYTPQLIFDGVDRKGTGLPENGRMAVVQLHLARAGEGYAAEVTPGDSAPARLAAYWAVTENSHVSAVKAGENNGATLKHDFVVRDYRPVSAWAAAPQQPMALRFTPALPADRAHPRSVDLVVIDAATGRPLQALGLGC